MANTKVTTGVIKDDAVGADQLAPNAVVTASMVDNAVTTAKIANDAILTAKISDNAVNNAKLSSNSVDSDQYVDGSIDTAHIADSQITSAKLDTNIAVDGTLTVGSHLNMGDGDILKMGASADLQIYHDGSNSYIKDTGTGRLTLQSATDFLIANTANTQNYIYAQESGYVRLYYAGATKLATATGGVTVTGVLTATSLDISGDIDVDGTTNLDVVDIDGAVDMASTLGVTGVVTANAGVVVDNFTIDGTQIDLSSGDLTLDVAGSIILDADSDGRTFFYDGGTEYGIVGKASNNLFLKSSISDGDILFQGNDGGSGITALTLDMSDAGTAIFNHDIVMGDSANIFMGNGYDLRLQSDGTNGTISAANGNLNLDVAGDIILDAANAGGIEFHNAGTLYGQFYEASNAFHIRSRISDGDINFQGSDGGSTITALTLDMSAAGAATFNSTVTASAINAGSSNEGVVKAGILQLRSSNTASSHFFRWDVEGVESANKLVGYWNDGNYRDRLSIAGNTGETVVNDSGLDVDFRVESDGNANMLFVDGGNNRVGIGTNAPTDPLTIHDGTPSIAFKDTSSNGEAFWQLDGVEMKFFNKSSGGDMVFGTANNTRWKMLAAGHLVPNNQHSYDIGGTNAEVRNILALTASLGGALASGRQLHVHGIIRVQNTQNANYPVMEFFNTNGQVGGIRTSNSVTSYDTSSDYRLKENVEPIPNGLARLQQLNPVKFDWKVDGTSSEGFIAHEVQEIFPDAVGGEKDGEEMQSMDYGKITPLLVKAIQEQQTLIESLTARIETLEG